MKKLIIVLQLLLIHCFATQAQNVYSLNDTYISLDDFSKTDVPATPETDFKKKGKFAQRFNAINLLGTLPTTGMFKDRPFRIIDETAIGYKVAEGSREIKVQVNKDEEPMDDVPGKMFLFGIPDGIILVQRFEGNLGYRVSQFDEWGKVKFKQVIPHTRIVEKDGEEIKQAYLTYFTHTDRFMVFNSLDSRDINKSIVIDLKDGKAQAYDMKICGVIRQPNEIAFNGYLIRDEKAKNLMVTYAGSRWMLKDNNITKVMGETIVSDSTLIICRYDKSSPELTVMAFHAKTGKPLWTGDVKQPSGAPEKVYMSMYNNKVIIEAAQPTGNYLQAFDAATGKRLYSTL